MQTSHYHQVTFLLLARLIELIQANIASSAMCTAIIWARTFNLFMLLSTYRYSLLKTVQKRITNEKHHSISIFLHALTWLDLTTLKFSIFSLKRNISAFIKTLFKIHIFVLFDGVKNEIMRCFWTKIYVIKTAAHVVISSIILVLRNTLLFYCAFMACPRSFKLSKNPLYTNILYL